MDGLVKNVMLLGVRTFLDDPILSMKRAGMGDGIEGSSFKQGNVVRCTEEGARKPSYNYAKRYPNKHMTIGIPLLLRVSSSVLYLLSAVLQITMLSINPRESLLPNAHNLFAGSQFCS